MFPEALSHPWSCANPVALVPTIFQQTRTMRTTLLPKPGTQVKHLACRDAVNPHSDPTTEASLSCPSYR